MRRSDREIRDPEQILAVMERCDVCRVAMNDDGYPYILPMNFGMETVDGQLYLYFHGAAEGRKYELLEKDDRVSFEMDCDHRLIVDEEHSNCTMEYESVIGRGRMELLSPEETLEALKVLMRHYRRPDFPINEAVLPITRVMRLRVESMTAKARKKRH